MANRRSLATALDMSPEQRAFISGSVKTPSNEQPRTDAPLSPEPDDSQTRPVATNSTPSTAVNDSVQLAEPRRLPASISKPRKRTDKLLPDDDSIVWISQMLVPLTTRLQPATAAALKRAGLEQKLRGRKPATVQEIAEAALQHWLRDHQFLD